MTDHGDGGFRSVLEKVISSCRFGRYFLVEFIVEFLFICISWFGENIVEVDKITRIVVYGPSF